MDEITPVPLSQTTVLLDMVIEINTSFWCVKAPQRGEENCQSKLVTTERKGYHNAPTPQPFFARLTECMPKLIYYSRVRLPTSSDWAQCYFIEIVAVCEPFWN